MIREFSILTGDARQRLRDLPDGSVHCVVTSPPYFGLRDYGVDGQVGLEARPDCGGWASGAWCGECFVCVMVDVFREVRRVLRDDGVTWLNLGDSYNAYNGNRGASKSLSKNQHDALPDLPKGHGLSDKSLKPKDLIGVPWRVAFALQSDGWYLRHGIVWNKPNPMPESTVDRPTTSHEFVFLLAKSERYFFDAEAVREDSCSSTPSGNGFKRPERISYQDSGGEARGNDQPWVGVGGGRNVRSVWTMPTKPFSGEFCAWCGMYSPNGRDGIRVEKYTDEHGAPARRLWCRRCNRSDAWVSHFATFPDELPRRCIEAGTSAGGCCPTCRTPYRRVLERGDPDLERRRACGGDKAGEYHGEARKDFEGTGAENASDVKRRILAGMVERTTLGWAPVCGCAVNDLPDAFEAIASPTGEGLGGDDPSLVTGRGGLNRPRGADEGVSVMTRYEQRAYARQLRALAPEALAVLEAEAGGPSTFAHYTRTDRAGARAIPAALLARWIDAGVLHRVEVPDLLQVKGVPCVVLDPFSGAGITGVAALGLDRRYIGIELNPDYAAMSRARIMDEAGPLLTHEVEAVEFLAGKGIDQ